MFEQAHTQRLEVNSDKTKYMLFSLSNNVVYLNTPLQLNNEVLEQVSEYKYLGVIVDRKFTYAQHTAQQSPFGPEGLLVQWSDFCVVLLPH